MTKLPAWVGKVGDHYYLISPVCDICGAKDDSGKSIRMEIDKFLITHDAKETAKMLRDVHGIPVDKRAVLAHYKNHSKFIGDIKEAVEKRVEETALSKVEAAVETYIDPDTVLEEIITIGGNKLRAGELEVSAGLLLGALREQGNRQKVGTLRDLLDNLDRQRFSGNKVAEGHIDENESKSANS